MPEDTLTVRIDPSNSFDVLQRLGGATDRLGQSGERIGAGFLRGDRVVRTATANITQGLLTANNAADATIIAMQSLERVFKIPIGLTIFAAGAIAAGAAIVSMIEKAAKLNAEIEKLSSFSKSGSADFLGTDKIQGNLDSIKTKIEELSGGVITRTHSLIAALTGAGGIGPLSGIIPAQNAADQERITVLQEAAKRDVLELTEKQNDLNAVALNSNKDQAELDKERVTHNERLGKLAQDVVAAGLAGTDAARQLLSTENDRYNIALAILRTKQSETKAAKELKQQQDTAKQAQDFFLSVGSGKFIKDLGQKQTEDQQRQSAKDQIQELQQAKDQGIPLGPNAEAILKEADRISARQGGSIQDLITADFSNLLELSQYDFSGLQPLSGLTLQIQ